MILNSVCHMLKMRQIQNSLILAIFFTFVLGMQRPKEYDFSIQGIRSLLNRSPTTETYQGLNTDNLSIFNFDLKAIIDRRIRLRELKITELFEFLNFNPMLSLKDKIKMLEDSLKSFDICLTLKQMELLVALPFPDIKLAFGMTKLDFAKKFENIFEDWKKNIDEFCELLSK